MVTFSINFALKVPFEGNFLFKISSLFVKKLIYIGWFWIFSLQRGRLFLVPLEWRVGWYYLN